MLQQSQSLRMCKPNHNEIPVTPTSTIIIIKRTTKYNKHNFRKDHDEDCKDVEKRKPLQVDDRNAKWHRCCRKGLGVPQNLNI